MKKVNEINSVNEMAISTKAKAYFRSKNAALEDLVWYSRRLAYYMDNGIDLSPKPAKARFELVKALDEAGFIRHDLNPLHFAVGRLFTLVNGRKSDFISADIESMDNAIYENQQCIAKDQVELVKQSIRDRLTERQASILIKYCGLDDGEPKNLEQIGMEYHITRESARQILMKARREFSYYGFPLEIEPREEVKVPEGVTDGSPIEDLDLSMRAYRCLKCAEVSTIAEILALSKEELFNIRNIGRRSAFEVIQKMHAMGHVDFPVDKQ